MKLKTLQRYWDTTKYLKISQIVNRIIKKISYTNPGYYSHERIQSCSGIQLLSNDLRAGYTRETFKGDYTFQFLNKEIFTGGSWFPEGVDQLWIYNLHYFDYLFDTSFENGKSLILDWIERVPVGAKDAWHSYTVSIRVCNWIWNFKKIFSDESEQVQLKILNSIKNQLIFINNNIEFDVVGNHIVENCKALIIGGAFFNDTTFIKKGLKILKDELKEQILEDGGHYERSVMYHCIVLEDLIAVSDCLKQSRNHIPEWLQTSIEKMIDFLQYVSKSDTIPLLNDSAYGICLSPTFIVSYFGKLSSNKVDEGPVLLKDSGIFLYNSRKINFLFDCGKLCPDFLPAHAHNDMLSYTLTLFNTEVITDSGVYEYKKGKWRDYFRSGLAHNCVIIDGRNPCDTWESFRVGKRGYPYGLKLSDDGLQIECWHSCYRNIGVEILRVIKLFPEMPCLYVSDMIVTKSSHNYESRIQIAPGFTHSGLSYNDSMYVINFKKGELSFNILTAHSTNIEKTWYSPEFGLMHERDCITISGKTSQYKTRISYVISAAQYEMSLNLLKNINNENGDNE